MKKRKKTRSIREAAIGRLGGVTKINADERAREAYKSGFYDRTGEDEPVEGTLVKRGYRRSKAGGQRELGLIDPDELLEIVWLLWTTNPISKRATALKRDYIVSRGTSPQVKDPDLQEILDDFWSVNKLNLRITEFAMQLFLFGEQCFPAFVRKLDGRVKLGYIDPTEIEMVVTHPDNALEKCAVIVKATEPINLWEQRRDRRVYRIIREEEQRSGGLFDDRAGEATEFQAEWWDQILEADAMEGEPEKPEGPNKDDVMAAFKDKLFDIADKARPNKEGKLVMAEQASLEEWEHELLKSLGLKEYSGSCFYFSVNTVSNQARGMSDFTQVADYCDQHDVILFGLGDREQLANYFSWDVTMTGADEQAIRKRSKQLVASPPRRGSVNVHNESEVWAMMTPDIQAAASIESARAMQLMVLGGLGYPEAWFGRGDETNRATLQGQGDPTWKTLEHDQFYVQNMFLEILYFVKDQAIIAKKWAPSMDEKTQEEIDHDINLPMPEMTAADTSATSSMLSSLASALVVAEEQGWHDAEASREIWAKGLIEFGIELEISKLAEVEELADEKTTDEETGDKEKGFGQEAKSYFAKHGVMLPDAESAEAEEYANMSDANKKELYLSFLRRVGMQAEADQVEMVWAGLGEDVED